MTQPYSTPHPHILIVEDHPVFRKFLLSWLGRSFRVTAVSDGFEALRWLQEGNQTSAVLLDMEMPRLSGIQFLQNIRHSGLFNALPVVALTANPSEAVRERCRSLQVTEVFPKPYQPQALLDALNRAMALAAPPTEESFSLAEELELV